MDRQGRDAPATEPDYVLGLFGGVIAEDPIITIGKYAPYFDLPLGLLSARPEVFAGRRSLNLLGLMFSQESDEAIEEIWQSLQAANTRFPEAIFVILANTPDEQRRLTERGIDAIFANELIFTDETQFSPRRQGAPEFDAVYLAELKEQKRHHLAADIPSLLLIHYKPADDTLASYRRMLPGAHWANYVGETYRFLSLDEVGQALIRCEVGLCLSAAEGAMRASMEYLLSGLPVVTTPSKGGRDRYIREPVGITVEPTKEAVAAGVRRLQERYYDPAMVRRQALAWLAEDRLHFMAEFQRRLADFGGPSVEFAQVLAAFPLRRRSLKDQFGALLKA